MKTINTLGVEGGDDAPEPETVATFASGGIHFTNWFGRVFDVEYSLKYPQATKYTTGLGYFHGLRMRVFARSENEAVETLRLLHDDGVVEAVKAADIGQCVCRFDAGARP